jgi:DNA-binding CsgD family transcriptional regulator
MADNDRRLAALPAIYEAASDAARMSHLADAIAHAFDAESAIICLCRKPDPTPEVVRLLSATDNFDDWARASYATYYHQRDEWYARGIKKPVPAVILGQELIEDQTFSRTEFCADWCEKIGFFHVLGAQFHVDGLVGTVGLHRPRRAAPFGETERRRMNLFIPHLRHAFELSWRLSRLEEHQCATEQALERLGWGLALLDEAGRILQFNRAAEILLASGDGLGLVGGKLVATDAETALQLGRVIVAAAAAARGCGAEPGGDLCINCRRRAEPLLVSVMPLRSGDAAFAGGRACVAVFLRARATASVEGLAGRISSLTPRQREVAGLAVQGLSNLQIAQRLSLSEHTVKDHLKDIFEKLSVRSRGALVAKVLGLNGIGAR